MWFNFNYPVAISMHFYVKRKGKLKCALSEYHCLLHLQVGKITLSPLWEFRDANENIQAPFVLGFLNRGITSISETQIIGAKYSKVMHARK